MRQTQGHLSAAPKPARVSLSSSRPTSSRRVRGGIRRGAVVVASWSAALLLSLILLLYCLARLGVGAPVAHRAAPHAFGGALSITLGNPPAVTAVAAYVYDPDLGFVYYAKDADEERPMASCTKMMTALLAVERGNLDQLVTIGADAAALAAPGNSHMGVSQGEKISLRDLLYGLMLPSGNDAAVAIADAIGGNVPNFVAMMNARAQQLGLTHTHFENPHGLDAPGHYTTARDLAVLAATAMRNPTLVQIASTYSYKIPATSTHKAFSLITGDDIIPGARSPYPGAIGVKPGWTGGAGYCEAFAAIRHGHLIVGTVMGEPDWRVRLTDMRKLLDWGFEEENIPAAPSPIPYSYPTPEP